MTFLYNHITKEGQTISGVNSGAKMHGNDRIPVRLDQAVTQISLACTNGSQPNSLPRASYQNIDCLKDLWLTSVPLIHTDFFLLHRLLHPSMDF